MTSNDCIVLALACAVAACAWLLTGLGRAEWRRILLWLRRRTKVLLARLHAVLARVSEALSTRFGEAADEHASLGEVSEMIDIVRLGLSAGLSFDAALEIYCSSRESELASRLGQALVSWRSGLGSREGELMAVAADMHVRALESFAIATGEALALGAPLADTLLAQSREIRSAHRASVERAIERAPVKLLIPTGTLILPALLLSILGPLLAAGGMM